MAERNRLILIEFHQPPLKEGRFTGPLKHPQVQQVTLKDARKLKHLYLGAKALGAKRVVIARIESKDEVE